MPVMEGVGFQRVTEAEAEEVGWAELVAVMVTVLLEGTAAGAV